MPLFGEVKPALEKLKNTLTKVGETIRNWELKRGKLFVNWLNKKIDYIEKEQDYDPLMDNYYKRRDIVHVDLGFNVGSEDGGGHYAIVLWASQKSKTITVIPITSEKPGSYHNKNIHVPLEELLEDGVVNWAKVEQIRCVSKLRVSYPNKPLKVKKVPPELMNKIDGLIISLYTKPVKLSEDCKNKK